MAQVIISNDITERLSDGSTTEPSHIATLQLPGLSKRYKDPKNYPSNS